eukprot:368600-Rhodomonas_salina.1
MPYCASLPEAAARYDPMLPSYAMILCSVYGIRLISARMLSAETGYSVPRYSGKLRFSSTANGQRRFSSTETGYSGTRTGMRRLKRGSRPTRPSQVLSPTKCPFGTDIAYGQPDAMLLFVCSYRAIRTGTDIAYGPSRIGTDLASVLSERMLCGVPY